MKKRNSIKIGLLLSLLLNLFLISHYILIKKSGRETNITRPMPPTEDISDRNIFEKIFIQKNDSIYKHLFNSTFEERPLQSYLLANTYYLLKKDTLILKDIKMVSVELKGIYGASPIINICK